MSYLTLPFIPAFGSLGLVAPDSKLYFYLSGTSTPVTVYADADLTTPLSNPVVANAGGRFADIYLDDDVTYRIRLESAFGSLIDEVDPYTTALGSLSPSGGSALVGFLQAGTGAVARTAQAKMRDLVSVKDFGALGDNTNDDTGAFTLTIAYALAYGKGIWIPAGIYKITSRITATLPNPAVGVQATGYFAQLFIHGEGSDRTRINCTASGFLKIVGSSQQHSFDLQDFAVMSGTTGGYTGIEADCGAYPFFGEFTAKSIVKLHFRGNDGVNGAKYWGKGFDGIDWSNIDFSHSVFDGTYNVTVASGDGCTIRTVASQFACQFYFTNTIFRFQTRGLVVGDGIQSVKMDSPFFAMNSRDIHVPSGQTDHQDFQIVNMATFGHAPGERIVVDSAFPNFIINGGAVGVSDGHIGFKFNVTSQTSILGVQFFPDTVANSAVSAIDIAGTVAGSHCIIENCNFASVTVGVRLQGTSSNVRFGASNKCTSTMTLVTNSGANNDLGATVAFSEGKVGYVNGAGGTVTQLTSKTTGVTINKPTGSITTHNASLAGGAAVQFTVTNSAIQNDDTIVPVCQNGNYEAKICNVTNGSFDIRLKNDTGGALADAVTINFALLVGATS